MAALQLSVVQALLSLHTLAVPAQTPPVHRSLLVHKLPSLQPAPLAMLVWTQLPVLLSQVSVVQVLLSLHVAAAPAQTPVVQTSVVVQRLPSSHTVPATTLV